SVRVEQHFKVLHEAVASAGGVVFATMGDGIAAAFTSAHAAARAAVAGQRGMPATGLSVRMGIHTGEVEQVGDDFRGRTVNRAARVMGIGHGGQILMSGVTAALVRSEHTDVDPIGLIDLGTHRLRDLADPEHVWQLTHRELSRDFPPVRGVDTFANNLPIQRSSLVGRERDVERVVELVRTHPIVTLTGVGGVGKTRLAVQAAADLLPQYGNVWFVELASVADPDDVADAIALTMGVGAVSDPLGAVAMMLAGTETLLVIDNCEHLVDSAADVIDRLTTACPGLSVIATSRETLGIDGEHVVTVRSLDPATTAVDLFRQRAIAAGADPDTLDHETIEHICRRLDGIPLAIELAAARAATLGVPAIVGMLDDLFNVLSSGRRRAVDRHGTMRATIAWSYRLLPRDEQRMLQWLSVFNGFELDAAAHVAATLGFEEHAAADHVASLVHKSMVTAESHERGVRFRMLETMRAFAAEQLDAEGDRHEASMALAEWVATVTDLPFSDPCDALVERNSIRLEREADNWRDAAIVAARVGDGGLAARLCGPPVAYFLLMRHDLAGFVRPLLALAGTDRSRRRAVLCALMVSDAGATDLAQLEAWADEMRVIDELEPTGLGALMGWLSFAWRGDFVSSVALCSAASLDERLAQATRDMLVGIAILDHFSLTAATDDRYGLIGRALEAADRSDVAITRVTCRLGAAWGLAATEPDRSLELVRRALADIADVPALTRLTLPGSASRLLAQLDPRVAALGLLEQIDETAARRSFVDLIPLSYAAALLHRVGHPAATSALATMAVSPIAPYLSMMDFVDLARRASSGSSAVSLDELHASVRAALLDIASRDDLEPMPLEPELAGACSVSSS
ncbi:MAG: hypothetical protein ABWZ99_13320, partial [Ilumatobacteraceae bacterium]